MLLLLIHGENLEFFHKIFQNILICKNIENNMWRIRKECEEWGQFFVHKIRNIYFAQIIFLHFLYCSDSLPQVTEW